MEEVEAWRNRRSSRSIHLLSSTASTYLHARTEYGVQQVARHACLRRQRLQGCPWPLDQRDGEQACLMQRSSTSCGLAAVRSWHPVHGWRERIGGRAPGCIPACCSSALHRTPHPQFHPLHPTQSGGVHSRSSRKLIWRCHQRRPGPSEFEKFKTDWQAYPGAVSVWKTISHVEQLYNCGSAVCKIMTTNANESVNSSFRKGDQERRFFPNEDADAKIFYLRIQELL